MKKATLFVNTTSETILAFVLLGVLVTSFLLTYNLSNINVIKESEKEVLGTFVYTDTFNPIYTQEEYYTVKDAELDVGGENLNINIDSKKSEERIYFITIYNKETNVLSINAILDFVDIDENANYYLLVNDKEQLVKDSYKPEQYNVILDIEPQKEIKVGVKVKSLSRINTEFNVVFSEN